MGRLVVTGGWSPAPGPCPAGPEPPWEELLWDSFAVTLLLAVETPPASESSIFPPLLQPAPHPFRNLKGRVINQLEFVDYL